MKKVFLLSVMVVFGVLTLSNVPVSASEVEGGQVSVPGKITFQTEDSKETRSSSSSSSRQTPKDNGQGKKFYSVLPKTGENKSNVITTVFGIILLGFTVHFLKKEVRQ